MCATKVVFPGFDSPAAGFEAPLEMLSACHSRVERQCQTLQRLVPHLAANGPDQSARDAAQNILRYFDTSAKHHHADEEEDLFPAMLQAVPETGMPTLRVLIDALCAEHRELEQIWGQVRWKLEGIWLGLEPDLGADEVAQMAGFYQRHIAREEDELLPLATRLLGEAQLDAVGRAMRMRRGIKEV